MYTIKTLNAISPVGLAKLNNKQFDVAVDTDAPDGILVRSADMLNTAFNDNLLAIARAGAGVNNIPLERCSEQGIVVFKRSALRTRIPSGASASTVTSNWFLGSFASPTGLMALSVLMVYIVQISLLLYRNPLSHGLRRASSPEGRAYKAGSIMLFF